MATPHFGIALPGLVAQHLNLYCFVVWLECSVFLAKNVLPTDHLLAFVNRYSKLLQCAGRIVRQQKLVIRFHVAALVLGKLRFLQLPIGHHS